MLFQFKDSNTKTVCVRYKNGNALGKSCVTAYHFFAVHEKTSRAPGEQKQFVCISGTNGR